MQYQTLGEQKVVSASEILAIEFPVGNEWHDNILHSTRSMWWHY